MGENSSGNMRVGIGGTGKKSKEKDSFCLVKPPELRENADSHVATLASGTLRSHRAPEQAHETHDALSMSSIAQPGAL